MDILELIKQAQNGQPDAFGQIYDNYAQLLFRFIKTKVQNQQQAEDILQEAFIKAWGALPRLKTESAAKFKSWMYTIAANCINDHFRKAYRKPESLELDENINISDGRLPEKDFETASDIAILKETINLLPEQYREIIELRFVQDIDSYECAKILNKNSVSVRVLQYRALNKLKELLKQRHDMEY